MAPSFGFSGLAAGVLLLATPAFWGGRKSEQAPSQPFEGAGNQPPAGPGPRLEVAEGAQGGPVAPLERIVIREEGLLAIPNATQEPAAQCLGSQCSSGGSRKLESTLTQRRRSARMQKARELKGFVATNSSADGKKLYAKAKQAPAAAEEELGEEPPELPDAEADAEADPQAARLLLLVAGTPLLLFLAAVWMCSRAAAPIPMASEEEEEPEGEDPLPAEKEGLERSPPGSAGRGAVARLPSPSRCVAAAAAARRSPQASPGREGAGQDRAAAPEREEPALSPLVPRGQLFQSSPPAEPNPEAEPTAEEDHEPPREQAAPAPQDEATRRAERLLQESWVRGGGAAPIFEEEEDERRYLTRRSEALSCFVEAFYEQRASNDVLRKAGEWLINDLERLQEETRQNAGELEYYRTLAEDFEAREAATGDEAEQAREKAREEASPVPAPRMARTP